MPSSPENPPGISHEQGPEVLQGLRERIDAVDTQIVALLAKRMSLVSEVGDYKRDNGIAPLDPSRWDAVLQARVAQGEELGLRPEFVETVYNQFHDEALAIEVSDPPGGPQQ